MTVSTTLLDWPSSAADLRDALGIKSNDDLRCHGKAKRSGKPCKTKIQQVNIDEISSLLSKIISHNGFDAAKLLFKSLSGLVMCQEYHQDQADGRRNKWELELKHDKAIKQDHAAKDAKPLQSFVQVSPVKVKDEPDSASSGIQSGVKKEEPGADRAVTANIKVEPSSGSPSRSSSRKTSKPETKAPTKAAEKHHFQPYHNNTLSQLKINKVIRTYLLRPLTKTEKEKDGLIYIYVFPENYHDKCPFFKIGNSKDSKERFKSWESKCGYTPKSVATHSCDNFVKAERLVHKQLRNSRKEETGCPKCKVWHNEWFDVRHDTACSTAALWANWMRLQPYEASGELKQVWKTRLDQVDLTQPDCWNKFVISDYEDDGVTAAAEKDDQVTIAAEKDDQVTITAEKDDQVTAASEKDDEVTAGSETDESDELDDGWSDMEYSTSDDDTALFMFP